MSYKNKPFVNFVGGEPGGHGIDNRQPSRPTSSTGSHEYPIASSQAPLKSYSTQPFPVASSGVQPAGSSSAKPSYPAQVEITIHMFDANFMAKKLELNDASAWG